ncbi:MAG TPA: nuclear transport factor 2 family protein [Vicinamibacterales bacterium]|nr:nuclear transport factor 2 family protein [Vicinamibacterales bacterium]
MRFDIAAALVLTLTAAVGAQRSTPAVEREIRALEDQWNDARAHADVAALDRLLADGWTVVHGDGTMNTKAEYLADLKSGARKFNGGVTVGNFAVRVYGDTAVASGTSESTVTINGKPQGGSLRFTRVYVRRDGRWVMIATHATQRR